MSLEGATIIKYNLLNKKILESAFLVSTEIKNTVLFDSLESYSMTLGLQTIEKSYDSIVLVESSSFVFQRLLWGSAKLKACDLISEMGIEVRFQIAHKKT